MTTLPSLSDNKNWLGFIITSSLSLIQNTGSGSVPTLNEPSVIFTRPALICPVVMLLAFIFNFPLLSHKPFVEVFVELLVKPYTNCLWFSDVGVRLKLLALIVIFPWSSIPRVFLLLSYTQLPSVSLERWYTSRLYALISSPYISETFNPSSSNDMYLLSLPNLKVPSRFSSNVFWPNLNPTIPESTLPWNSSSAVLNPRSTPRPIPVNSVPSLRPRKDLIPTMFSLSIWTVLPFQSLIQSGRTPETSSTNIPKSPAGTLPKLSLLPSNVKNVLPSVLANWNVPSSKLK